MTDELRKLRQSFEAVVKLAIIIATILVIALWAVPALKRSERATDRYNDCAATGRIDCP